jgi:hypothetical protein
MKKGVDKLFYFLPRILAILFIIFISIFAFNVFRQDFSFFVLLGKFFVHLIPSFLLIFLLVISWKREFFGGVLFIVLGLVYVIKGWNFPFIAKLTITGPLFLIGILFIINDNLNRKRGEKMAKKKAAKKTAKKKK